MYWFRLLRAKHWDSQAFYETFRIFRKSLPFVSDLDLPLDIIRSLSEVCWIQWRCFHSILDESFPRKVAKLTDLLPKSDQNPTHSNFEDTGVSIQLDRDNRVSFLKGFSLWNESFSSNFAYEMRKLGLVVDLDASLEPARSVNVLVLVCSLESSKESRGI